MVLKCAKECLLLRRSKQDTNCEDINSPSFDILKSVLSQIYKKRQNTLLNNLNYNPQVKSTTENLSPRSQIT